MLGVGDQLAQCDCDTITDFRFVVASFQTEDDMKTLVTVVSLVGALALSTGAFASNSGDGSDYGTPGSDLAKANSGGCADAGAFNYLGKGWNLGIEASPGNDDPQHAENGSWPGPGTTSQTGINNSTNCGNPQGGPTPD
jgi:hypothetical protein